MYDIMKIHMKKRRFIFTIFNLILLTSTKLFSQQIQIQYNGSYNYTLKERSDLRRYDNGKYIGLMSREVTSFITPTGYKNGYTYEGSFFVMEATKRASESVGHGIKDSIPSSFKISQNGQLTMIEDKGYPSFRSFPSFSNQKIQLGDSWTAKAERAVDPLNKGIVTKMPIYVQYTYIGNEFLNGEPVYLLKAQWATRYGMGSGTSYIDWGGDPELEKATGKHLATIYVSKISGNSLIVRDTVDETFYYSDGNVIQFKGTISLFTEYPPSFDKTKLLPALKRIAQLSDEDIKTISDYSVFSDNADYSNNTQDLEYSDLPEDTNTELAMLNKHENLTSMAKEIDTNTNEFSNTPNNEKDDVEKGRQRHLDNLTRRVTNYMENNKTAANNKNQIAVDATPAGIRLSIQNLQFEPNSAKLLSNENSRLDQIAEVLNTVPEARLLVEGHTARIGTTDDEMNLSIARAKEVAQELAQRGISSSRFICKGHGGNKPIADNGTADGRAMNRRVEITILY